MLRIVLQVVIGLLLLLIGFAVGYLIASSREVKKLSQALRVHRAWVGEAFRKLSLEITELLSRLDEIDAHVCSGLNQMRKQ